MQEKSDAKTLDAGWGQEGAPLLPAGLRDAWKTEPLPSWIAAEMNLGDGATFAALDQSAWKRCRATAVTDRQRNFLLNLIQGRRLEIGPLTVFRQPIPYWLDRTQLPFSTRTRNCVANNHLLDPSETLSRLTYDDLFNIRSMGVVSILEFVCMVEAALERNAASTPEQGGSATEDQLLQIIGQAWTDQVGPGDPRFSDLIPAVPRATVSEILDALTSGPDVDTDALKQLARAVPELSKRLAEIAALPLEGQLEDFLRAVSRCEGDRLQALIDRLGWGGRPPITLEEAGEKLGITRERVRQLQEKITQRLEAIPFPVYMPALDAALQFLAERSPLSLDAATTVLVQQKLTTVGFHPASVIAAATACGRKPVVRLQSLKRKTVVVAAELQHADEILRVAYRQAHASGASNVGEVAAEMQAGGIAIIAQDVRQALHEFSEVEFLDDEWFCHRPGNPERDRLRNVTRRMLSVASRIELGIVRDGVRREYRYRGYRGLRTWSLLVPPRAVLRSYYSAHPEFTVDEDDFVGSTEPLDYRIELGLSDALLVDVLRSSPACVLDRESLATECSRRSMNMNTLSLYLTYSPVILHLDTDVWTLRGVRVDPAAVEAVRAANALRPKAKRILDHGWTQQGNLWLAARIPAAHTGTFVVSVPGAIKHYLSGREFDAKDEDGVSHGALKINDEGTSYGFGRFLRQRGADEGDILIAEFSLSNSAAVLRLGNDELLEELSPEA